MNIQDLIKEKKLKDLTNGQIVYIKDFESDYYGLIDYSGQIGDDKQPDGFGRVWSEGI